jgi:hypothetical protein
MCTILGTRYVNVDFCYWRFRETMDAWQDFGEETIHQPLHVIKYVV